MKCFEMAKCSPKERANCYVWQKFSDDMENIKCWVIRSVYHPENRDILKKCRNCDYFRAMNSQSGVQSDFVADIGLILCRGVLNNDRTRALSEVWEKMKHAGKHSVIVDLSLVTNIYSCGLGMVVKMHQEAEAAGGVALFVGVQGYPLAIFHSTKLSRLIRSATDQKQALQLIDSLCSKAAIREVVPPETASVSPAVPKVRPPCWEYWNNHNPKNANTCDECYRKLTQSTVPCWMVEGVIEGVSFQYVNEDCVECNYFREFGTGPAMPSSSSPT